MSVKIPFFFRVLHPAGVLWCIVFPPHRELIRGKEQGKTTPYALASTTKYIDQWA